MGSLSLITYNIRNQANLYQLVLGYLDAYVGEDDMTPHAKDNVMPFL